MLTLVDLQVGRHEEGDNGSDGSTPPLWYNKDRFSRGQDFFKRHLVSVTIAMHCSLVVGFSLPNLLEPLLFTNMSNSPEKSIKRYLTTFYYLLQWHTDDLFNNHSRAHKSLMKVRNMHKDVSKNMTNKKSNMRLYVSQYDMALVQYGFMAPTILYPSHFAIQCTEAELEDYIYFWKCVGYLLGMSDCYNMCLSDSYMHTVGVCKEIEQQVLLPTMLKPKPQFEVIAESYCQGINLYFHLPLFTKEAMFGFVYEIMNISGPTLTWSNWIRVYLYKIFIKMLRYLPWFENKLNSHVLNAFLHIEKVNAEKGNNKCK